MILNEMPATLSHGEKSMTDPRLDKLARTLIRYSCNVQPGEFVLIEAIDIPHAFTKSLIRETTDAGGPSA